MKRLFVVMLACALAACSTGAGTVGSTGPTPPISAPLERTTIDEKALIITAGALDAVALSTSALVKAGVVKPGTPLAQRIARSLDTARNGVNAAEAARQAGSAPTYAAALDRAQNAIDAIKVAIASIGA